MSKNIYDEKIVAEIMAENDAHNDAIGAGTRDRQRARRDAEFIYLCRHGGLSVETICMMLTDYEFALTNEKNAKAGK